MPKWHANSTDVILPLGVHDLVGKMVYYNKAKHASGEIREAQLGEKALER